MDEGTTPQAIPGLPENAFRELRDGEKYEPAIPAGKLTFEVTRRSIVIGLLMAVLFSAAVAYITLKLGQGIEAAIPISILAIGLSQLFRRRSTLLENVNIVALGATSGIVVGGSVFVMPAIYVLGIEGRSSFFQIFVVPLLGAILGVLFLIPFRRYFVAEMHGKLPFPEATATTEVLVAGEKGGSQARILVYSMAVGGIFDAFVEMRAWLENFTTELVGPLHWFTYKAKAIFALNTRAAIAGLGYLIGVRYAAIILAGSLMSYFVIVPIFAHLGSFMPGPIWPGHDPLACQGAVDLFDNYARKIGIGAIFAAGIMSIVKMLPIIIQAFRQAFREMFRSKAKGAADAGERTDRDIPMKTVVLMMGAVAVVLWLYLRFSVLPDVSSPTAVTTVAVGMMFLVSFLFAAVSAWAVAMISVTPISGMTLTTLLISALILSKLGLKGELGMLAMLLIGGVVCTALSMTGSLVTEFKIGYWLGSTPKSIQWSNILASVVSAVVVTGVIMLLDSVYGFENRDLLPAPQPNAMAEVARSMMGATAQVPWFLYGVGAAIAVTIELTGISALAFALGMYIPIEYNSPIIFGAVVAWFVRNRGVRKGMTPEQAKAADALGRARYDRGLLVASGLIAGGALMGVLSAFAKWLEAQTGATIVPNFENEGSIGNWMGLGLFLLLCLYMGWDAWRAKPDGDAKNGGHG